MSVTTWAWLVLAFPLAGTVVIALGWPVLRNAGRAAGWIGTGAIAGSFVCAIGTLLALQDRAEDARQVTSTLYDYAGSAGVNAELTILVDPLSVLMILVVAGVSMLIHLYSVTYMTRDVGFARYFSYLNYFVFSMLLLVLVAAPPGDAGGHQGVRHQRRRRRRPRARHVLPVPPHRHARLPRHLQAGRRHPERRRHRRLHLPARRRVRQERADPVPHVAGRRDGGPDAGQR